MPDSATPVELQGFPLVIEIPVHWGDQDAFGHVNNIIPLRWFESARVAYLERCGLGHLMNGGGLAPMVLSLTCRYRRQLRFPDVLLVGVRVGSMRRSSLVMEHVAFHQSLGEIAVEGTAVILFYDHSAGRLRRVSADIKSAMERFEGRPFVFEPLPVDACGVR